MKRERDRNSRDRGCDSWARRYVGRILEFLLGRLHMCRPIKRAAYGRWKMTRSIDREKLIAENGRLIRSKFYLPKIKSVIDKRRNRYLSILFLFFSQRQIKRSYRRHFSVFLFLSLSLSLSPSTLPLLISRRFFFCNFLPATAHVAQYQHFQHCADAHSADSRLIKIAIGQPSRSFFFSFSSLQWTCTVIPRF